MRKIRCPKCKIDEKVIRYSRDDPILSCGHRVTIKLQYKLDNKEMKDLMTGLLLQEVYDIMRINKVSFREAERILWTR